jgi:hypothetical protein
MTQTPFNSQRDQLYVSGTATLYDKTGKFLYKEKTGFGESVPIWSGVPKPGRQGIVFFLVKNCKKEGGGDITFQIRLGSIMGIGVAFNV